MGSRGFPNLVFRFVIRPQPFSHSIRWRSSVTVAMSSDELMSRGDSSNSTKYRPEIYILEQQWRRKQELKERVVKAGPVVEPDSGLGEDAASSFIRSLEPVQAPQKAAEDEKRREQDASTKFLLSTERRHVESGFATMEGLLDAEEEEELDLLDEELQEGGLIDDRDLPKPTEPEPEDIDDSPTPGQTVFHYFAVSEDPRYFLATVRPFIIAQDDEGDT